MASASRSTDLFLYSSVDKAQNSYRFSVDVDNDDVEFKAAQDFKFDAGAYEYKEGATYFNLATRFGSLESSTVGADNAAAIVILQAADATEANSRVAGDLARQNATLAEIAARVAAEAATRAAAITAVQLSISSILSNATAGSIDSLSEVVAAYSAGDTTLAVQAAALLTRLAACEDLLNDLTGSNLG